MKNKAEKLSIATGKYGSKKLMKHCRTVFFHKDNTARDIARKTFCKHIDNVITASYGSEFRITNKCVKESNDFISKQDIAEVVFQEHDPYIF